MPDNNTPNCGTEVKWAYCVADLLAWWLQALHNENKNIMLQNNILLYLIESIMFVSMIFVYDELDKAADSINMNWL